MCNSCIKDNSQIYILIFKAFHITSYLRFSERLYFLGNNESKILQKFTINAYNDAILLRKMKQNILSKFNCKFL